MILPEWMSEERPVVTKVGRNNFLIRNRHHLEALLQKFETHPLKVASVFHPTAKVLLLFFLLISVGISRNLTVLWILALFLGAGVAFLPHSILVRTLKKTVVLLIFPLVLYLPHLLLSGGQSLFLFRLPLIAVAIAYYSETSTISEMLAALKGLHFPNLVLLQLDITIKYIDVFGKQLMDLLKGIEARNELFKNDFPREYQTWTETAKTDFESEFNGNIAVDALEKRPEMVILWAGYAFSKDYSTPRGHMHAIEDITASLRTGSPMSPTEGPQPSTCWTCKSPDVPRMMEALGVDSFYNNKWGAMGAEIVNPIGCSDCHDPETMNLHISRPALIEAFQRQGKDITKATPQEMRSLVCAQCHVEYYFKGDGKYLTFPWDKGFTVEDMEAYYDEAGFYDYIHKLSRTPILKAQHPDYEICQMGIHGQRGVSCADCHMPYKSEGGVKFSDHHIQSPLAMIDRTCQVCHRESEETLRNNVYERQRKANEIRNRLEQELAKAHIEAKFAWDKGATETQMKDVLALIRQAQWRWDFGVASHGGSFHAPQEIQRILSHGLDRAMQARLAVSKVLAKNGYTGDVPMPDISTKAKAQEYIGLDMDAERATKEKFLKTTVPAWLEKAKENGRLAQK